MRRIPTTSMIVFLLLMAGQGIFAQEVGREPGLPERFSARLKQIESRLREIDTEMRTLPAMSDIDARGTHGFHSNFSAKSEEHWFEIRWDKPQAIDGIGMIPTRITTQSGLRSNYGFPVSLRIMATRSGSKVPFILATVANTRLDLRRGEPLFLDVKAENITSLRFIPVNLPTLPGKYVRFFSLAEVLVYQGGRNITREGKLTAAYSIDGEVGWNIHYLTDKQSPLGPPELPEPGASLGWHGDLARGAASPTWAIIDLGEPRDFDSIRLIAARGDAPLKGPGFGFPVKFHFEATDDIAAGSWTPLWSSGEKEVPNPGYNPVLVRFPAARGRYVRISIEKLHSPDQFTIPRILLSEMEVLNGTKNIALKREVSTPDGYAEIPHDATRVWSRAGLTDGFSSTGRLIPERDWVRSLSRRFDLICERTRLAAEQGSLVAYWNGVFLSITFGLLSAAVIGLLVWQGRQRMVNRRAVLALRNRISSDLHDEVGSNLATISLLSELAPHPDNLDDINRLSRETSLALREIVEINLSQKRIRKPLPDRLREIASLMLREQQWTFEVSATPVLDLEQRKNLVFFFKESLHNIIRHAGAKNVGIILEKVPEGYRLFIEDDGKGIENSPADVVGNLHTLRQRAEKLHGAFSVDSTPGGGTRLTLLFPVQFNR